MKPERAAELLREADSATFDEARSQGVERRVLQQLRAGGVGRRRASMGRGRLVTLAAAALALAALAVLVVRGGWQAPAQLALKDGSRAVAVSPDAHVVPELIAEDRVELRQTAGSVEYDITPRRERLFVVHVGSARVEVLGTAFRVDRSERAVHVAVTRGRVRVMHESSKAELTAGEEVTIATTAPSAERAQAPSPAAAAPAEPAPTASASPAERAAPSQLESPGALSAAELFLRADQARSAGDTAGALQQLRELLRAHPKDGRATLARFTIGRLESTRGNALAAAEAFESCGAALNGEALAEAALARAAAGQPDRARALALRYRSQFPIGPRAATLEKLAR